MTHEPWSVASPASPPGIPLASRRPFTSTILDMTPGGTLDSSIRGFPKRSRRGLPAGGAIITGLDWNLTRLVFGGTETGNPYKMGIEFRNGAKV